MMPIRIRAHLHFPWCTSAEEQTTALLRAQAYLRTYQGQGIFISLTSASLERGWEVVDNPRGRDTSSESFRDEVDQLLGAAWVHSSRVGASVSKSLATTEPEYSGEPLSPHVAETDSTLIWQRKGSRKSW